MAENRYTAQLERYLMCHFCLEILSDPVTLSCHHSFCFKCLKNDSKGNRTRNCPVCTTPWWHFPRVNVELKALADSFVGRLVGNNKKEEEEEEAEEEEEEEEEEREEEEKEEEEEEKEEDDEEEDEEEEGGDEKVAVCRKHKYKTKMFCEDEQRIVCLLCDPSPHQGHVVLPVEAAFKGLKEKLKINLVTLKERRRKYTRLMKEYKEVMQVSKIQALSTEHHMRAEFSRLHRFLQEQEESRLAALRQEVEWSRSTVARELEQLQEQFFDMSSIIGILQLELRDRSASLTDDYLMHFSISQDQCSQSERHFLQGVLLDVAKHVGNLSFQVWQKMKDEVHLSPVILDPKTAGCNLQLSDDLTALRGCWFPQRLPDNPERHTEGYAVIGYQGFSSGRHSWDVEVGDYSSWAVGLAKESVDRKDPPEPVPSSGLWCLLYNDCEYNIYDEVLEVEKNLKILRVQLDFDKGEVSFHNAEDMTHIYTHTDTFTEKLFPYFSFGPEHEDQAVDVKIRPVSVSVVVNEELQVAPR